MKDPTLILLAEIDKEARRLQREEGREERGIVSTQVKAVIIVLSRVLQIFGAEESIRRLKHEE